MADTMKNNIALIILLIAFLSVACNERQSNNRQLILADSLMQSRPDSALCILQGISMDKFATQADSACYALLLTQARDKNYVVQTDDSLIRYAVAYYDKTNDVRMQAKAHYYWGCVYRDMNRQAEAIREFLIAAPLTEKAKEKRQLGLVYNNIGFIYNIQGFNEKADSIYQLMEVIAQEVKDTALWSEALSKQGSIALTKGKEYFPIAEQKLSDAFGAVDSVGNNGLKANISASLSNLYSRMDEGEKALYYAKLNLSLRRDTARAYRAFLLLGDAYYKLGQYDSATFYLNKSLLSKDYGRKAGAYMRLADIAMIQGNAALSVELERNSSAYKDSLYKFRRSVVVNEIIEAETDAQAMLQKLYYKGRLNTYIYGFILITIIIVAIVLFLYRRYQRKNDLLQRDKQELEKINQDLNQHYVSLQTNIEQKNLEIEGLRKELASHQIDEEQRENLQAELDEMILKRRTLAKEAFLHSPLYTKMQAIIKDYQDRDQSDEEISDQEWQEFVVGMDIQWNNVITDLCAKYQLSKEELHLVCLSLAGFPFSHLEYLLHLSRKTLYRKKNVLLKRMGVEQNCGFEEILQRK
jgi:tetratricopeptide (TPR) repeat protein